MVVLKILTLWANWRERINGAGRRLGVQWEAGREREGRISQRENKQSDISESLSITELPPGARKVPSGYCWWNPLWQACPWCPSLSSNDSRFSSGLWETWWSSAPCRHCPTLCRIKDKMSPMLYALYRVNVSHIHMQVISSSELEVVLSLVWAHVAAVCRFFFAHTYDSITYLVIFLRVTLQQV